MSRVSFALCRPREAFPGIDLISQAGEREVLNQTFATKETKEAQQGEGNSLILTPHNSSNADANQTKAKAICVKAQ